MAAVCDLCLDILSRWPIPARNVVAHSDVAPDRKRDPGELFDWQGLATQGVGLWPSGVPGEDPSFVPDSAARAAVLLRAIGYPVDEARPSLAIAAFQRHWRQELVSGEADAGTLAANESSGGLVRRARRRRLKAAPPALTRSWAGRHTANARRPDGRWHGTRVPRLEESPGSTGKRCRLTAGGGQTPGKVPQKTNRPSAREETREPAGKGETVRQERTAPPATGAAGQTPPGARPNRGGRRRFRIGLRANRNRTQGLFRPAARVGRARRAARRVAEEWSSGPREGAGQNPAYRPSGTLPLRVLTRISCCNLGSACEGTALRS